MVEWYRAELPKHCPIELPHTNHPEFESFNEHPETSGILVAS
jgi:hypothetical protein